MAVVCVRGPLRTLAGGRPEHEREGDVVVDAVVLELELPRIAGERDVEAERAADGVRVGRDDPADFGKRHGEQHEVEAAQPEAETEKADDGAARDTGKAV